MPEERSRKEHAVTLEARKLLSIEGVRHVVSFADDVIVLTTEMGGLIIRGRTLRIQHVDLDSGHLEADGEVSALQYTTRQESRRPASLMEKLWR